MLEMGCERRPDLYEQRLQFLILRAGNQRLVYRVEHGLVIRHLVVDVGLVELCALEPLETLECVFAAFFQSGAGGILFRLHLEFCYEFCSRFIDAAMVGNHELRKVLHFFRGRLCQRQLTGIDIDLVGRDNNRSDLCVSDRLGGGIGSNPDLLAPVDARLREISPFRLRLATTQLGADAVLHGAVSTALQAAQDQLFTRKPLSRIAVI